VIVIAGDLTSPAGVAQTTMSPGEVESRVRAFLGNLSPNHKERIASMGPDEDIWPVVDSMGLLELVDYVEQTFTIAVEPLEFTPANFKSIAAISRLILVKAASKGPAL
jgi:acyl carrier protein